MNLLDHATETSDFELAFLELKQDRCSERPSLDTLFSLFLNQKIIQSEDLVSDVCYLVQKQIDVLSFKEYFDHYQEYFEMGLKSQNEKVRALTVRALSRCVDTRDNAIKFVNSSIFPLFLEGFIDESYKIAKLIQHVFALLSKYPETHATLFNSTTVSQLLDLKTKSSYRIHDLIVMLISEHFELILNAGLCDDLVKEFGRDLLGDLNRIETFSQIVVETEQGVRVLERLEVLRNLFGVCEYGDRLVEAAVIKFFGLVAVKRPEEVEYLQENYNLLGFIQEKLEETLDPSLKISLLTVIANVVASKQGFVCVLKQKTLLKSFMDVCVNAVGEVKIECAKTYSCLFSVILDDANLEDTLKNIYFESMLSGYKVWVTVLEMAKSAFEEERIAAYAVLKSLCLHGFGVKHLLGVYAFVECLKDRSCETTKVGKEWKYSILQVLVATADVEEIDNSEVKMFKGYIRDGPFYVHREANVAVGSL